MDLRESKSMLAKLLATENIKVEHGNYETAAFDPKKRVLYLPIFKWMDGDVYDLLVLHEVSHALNTPADGWHSSGNEKGSGYKSFLNVTEDARIEKKIKRKYPGASKSMVLGYRELMKNDFFGINHVNVDGLPLIDRINLHTKGGASMGISFTEDEIKWVDELMSLETFPEIVEFTDRLYDYCAENESMTDDHDFDMFSSDGYDEDGEEISPDMMGDSPFEWDDTEETEGETGMKGSSGESEDESDGEESSDSDGDSAETDESSNGSEETNSSTGSSSNENPESDKEDESDSQVNPSNTVGAEGGVNTNINPNAVAGPRSITDEFFRRKETELNDRIDSDKKYIYANLPKPILEKIIIDYKQLARLHEWYYNQEKESGYWGTMTPSQSWSTAPKRYKEFREQNKSIVDYLAKEFGMKKRADEYKRTASANTGVLETSKLYSYKYSDNLFKRVATVTSGKNHGLVMFIDWSGSMSSNMAGTVEQMMILVMFCKKVNIPFDVYAFTDRMWRSDNESILNLNDSKEKWDYQPGDFCEQDHFNLMQLFSSKMSNIEFNKACWNAINIRDHYQYKTNWHYNGGQLPSIPGQYCLGGTPLNATIVASHELVRRFKRDHNVQIVNTVFLTDGDSSQAGCYLDSEGKEQHIGRNDQLTIRDIPSKSEVERSKTLGWSASHRATTETLFNSLRKATGANIIGFFLVNRLDRNKASYYSTDNKSFETMMDSWRKEKCIVTEIDGYDNLYIIKDGSDLQIDERSELDKVDAGSKKSAIRTAFRKMNRKKLRNRVVLNKFIEQVA